MLADSGIPPASKASAPGLVGNVVSGRYRIVRQLGAGGMATVYQAEHIPMRKAVALKVLNPAMTCLPEMVARFEREAVAVARIEHPNVAGAHDFGRLSDGSFYLVLEYVRGHSLRSVLSGQSALSPQRALAIARQIAAALVAAHGAGVVHRDLKPDNVMLVERPDAGDLVKVLDFGIAKLVSDDESRPSITQVGALFGTPDYMAPEQVAGLPVDSRADLYSLGVLLYRMLAGRTPFGGGTMTTVLARQLAELPPALPPGLDPRVSKLVMSLLEKEPDRRVQSAAALCQEIDALLARTEQSTLDDIATESVSEPVPREMASEPPRPPLPPAEAPRLLSAPPMPTLPQGTPEGVLQPVDRNARVRLRRTLLGYASGVLLVAGVLVWGGLGLRARENSARRPAPAAGLSASALATALGIASRSAQPAQSVASPARDDATIVRKLAKAGESASLKQLEDQRGPKEVEDYLALGGGYAVLGDTQKSLERYRTGLKLDPSRGSDLGLLRDLRQAGGHSDHQATVIELASLVPGEAGPDLLFELWDAMRRANKADSAKRIRGILDRDPAKSSASPALRIALDLWRVQSCESYRKLLPRAIRDGDQRVLPVLQSMLRRTGCGRRGRGDCFACLRGGQLARAIEAAENRPAPAF